MLKFLFIGVIFASIGLAMFLIYYANKKTPVKTGELELELEESRELLNTKLITLINKKEIKETQKQIAAIDAKLSKL
jgi:hypothetical protein